ncbi:ABC transporter ATP-binding protein [Mycoplasmoides genitalium]|uniref:ATP-binding cassette domain-containing protein n=1 Tax=Mycoplasmoides genitalium TaxID=2097 RepID=UPI00031453B3|nr:ABC transporter ATP-binding protein [Mycoplasmoides genitalium]
MENKPILSFEKVSIIYKKAPLLQNISFKVMAKENVCLLGKSGVGKSSLLNSVTNTKIVKSGLVYFDGVASNKKEYKKLEKTVQLSGSNTKFNWHWLCIWSNFKIC